ncbi:hypothetical protein GCM10011322_41550 [Salinarimonas ramus]|uniref:Uncharacterized protein n=2 Tax=Salinarimonas ramus TaxID=690164 RepID=A0A917QGX5_9HYPH|nr:hypothetical protein GCM10011322_41550 [Salinarimonas ramus]
MILTTLKITIVVGALSWVAADYMSSTFDRDALARLASDGREREPLITGSVPPDALRLNALRLDPCGDLDAH